MQRAGCRLLVPVVVVGAALVEAVPVEGAVVVADDAVNDRPGQHLVYIHPAVDHLGRPIRPGSLHLGAEVLNQLDGGVLVLVGLERPNEFKVGGNGAPAPLERPDLLVEVPGAVVEVVASEAAVDLLGEGEHPDVGAVDDQPGVDRPGGRHAHFAEQPVAEALVHLRWVQVHAVELQAPQPMELPVRVIPVDLHLHRQLGADLVAGRVRPVRVGQAADPCSDRSLVPDTDPVNGLTLEAERPQHPLLGRGVTVDLGQSLVGQRQLERVQPLLVEDVTGIIGSERRQVPTGFGDGLCGSGRRIGGDARRDNRRGGLCGGGGASDEQKNAKNCAEWT